MKDKERDLMNTIEKIIMSIILMIPIFAPLPLWMILNPMTFWQRLVMTIVHAVLSIIMYILITIYMSKEYNTE